MKTAIKRRSASYNRLRSRINLLANKRHLTPHQCVSQLLGEKGWEKVKTGGGVIGRVVSAAAVIPVNTSWSVNYIYQIRYNENMLYVGRTNDYNRRLLEHAKGRLNDMLADYGLTWLDVTIRVAEVPPDLAADYESTVIKLTRPLFNIVRPLGYTRQNLSKLIWTLL